MIIITIYEFSDYKGCYIIPITLNIILTMILIIIMKIRWNFLKEHIYAYKKKIYTEKQ